MSSAYFCSACGLLRSCVIGLTSVKLHRFALILLSRRKFQCPSRHAPLSPNFSLQSRMLYRIRTTRVAHSGRSLSPNVASKVHRAAIPWVLSLSRIARACRECRRKDISCSFPDPQPNSYSNDSPFDPRRHLRNSHMFVFPCQLMLIAQEAQSGSRRPRRSCSSIPFMIRLSQSEADIQTEGVCWAVM